MSKFYTQAEVDALVIKAKQDHLDEIFSRVVGDGPTTLDWPGSPTSFVVCTEAWYRELTDLMVAQAPALRQPYRPSTDADVLAALEAANEADSEGAESADEGGTGDDRP